MDIQVTERDAVRLRAAHPAADWLPIPSANHVFQPTDSRDPARHMASYGDRTLSIVPQLVEGVALWIEKRR
jgi:hypothetical protein